MRKKFINITDPETMVTFLIFFRNGGHVYAHGKVKIVREAMAEWKKYMLYAGASEEKRKEMEKPFFLYHLLEMTNDPCVSFHLGDVCAMQYIEIDDEEEEKMEAQKQMLSNLYKTQEKLMNKALEDMTKGDEWREKPGGE